MAGGQDPRLSPSAGVQRGTQVPGSGLWTPSPFGECPLASQPQGSPAPGRGDGAGARVRSPVRVGPWSSRRTGVLSSLRYSDSIQTPQCHAKPCSTKCCWVTLCHAKLPQPKPTMPCCPKPFLALTRPISSCATPHSQARPSTTRPYPAFLRCACRRVSFPGHLFARCPSECRCQAVGQGMRTLLVVVSSCCCLLFRNWPRVHKGRSTGRQVVITSHPQTRAWFRPRPKVLQFAGRCPELQPWR